MLRKLPVYVRVMLDSLCHRVGKLLSNKTAEIDNPDCVLSDLARCFVEDVRTFFTIDANQAAYEKWKRERERKNELKATEKA